MKNAVKKSETNIRLNKVHKLYEFETKTRQISTAIENDDDALWNDVDVGNVKPHVGCKSLTFPSKSLPTDSHSHRILISVYALSTLKLFTRDLFNAYLMAPQIKWMSEFKWFYTTPIPVWFDYGREWKRTRDTKRLEWMLQRPESTKPVRSDIWRICGKSPFNGITDKLIFMLNIFRSFTFPALSISHTPIRDAHACVWVSECLLCNGGN